MARFTSEHSGEGRICRVGTAHHHRDQVKRFRTQVTQFSLGKRLTQFSTCRPAGALEFGVSTFLQTCGISIALIIHLLDPSGADASDFAIILSHVINITLFKSEKLKADEASSALSSKMRIAGSIHFPRDLL